MTKMKYTLGTAVLAAALLGMPAAHAEEVNEEAAYEEEAEAPAEAEAPVITGMPNPYIEYKDVPALERAIGFPVLYLPANFYASYHPAVHVYGIHGQVADVRFQSKLDGSTIALRTAVLPFVNTNDISGFYSVDWKQESAGDMNNTQIYTAVSDNGTRVVRWTAGNFVFSLAINNADDSLYKALVKNFVIVADRFSHKYHNTNFEMNPSAKRILAEEKAAAAAAAIK